MRKVGSFIIRGRDFIRISFRLTAHFETSHELQVGYGTCIDPTLRYSSALEAHLSTCI